MNETDNKVDACLAQWGIAFKARYIGETTEREAQRVDHFRVSIGAYETDFYQGFGHRESTPTKAAPWRPVKITRPTAASVLYCLLSDAAAIHQSFTDWVSELGMDTDSRKVLAIYEACCDIGHALRKVFTHAQRAELTELLQEY